MAIELAKRGAKVAVNYANAVEGAEAVVKEIKALGNGSDAAAFKANVGNVEETSKLMDDVAPILVSFLSVTSPMLSPRSLIVSSTSTPVVSSSLPRRHTSAWKLVAGSSLWVPSLVRQRVYPSMLSTLDQRVPLRPSPGAWLSVCLLE
jgi:hypothetical protein